VEKTINVAATAEADGPNSNVAAVRLRGLPFSMSAQDVLAFFAQYDVCDRIADVPQAAQLLPKANGRPSGQARVQMRSRYDAEVVQQALHNQWIGGRYIEVFVYGEEDEKQANDFNAQLGYPAGVEPKAAVAGDPVQSMNGSMNGFPGGFPPIFSSNFPTAGPGAPPWTAGPGAPPWAHMLPPSGPGPAAGMPGGQPAPSPVMGTSLDTLFSFLYNDKPVESEGADVAVEQI
jgi:hypothetical protein